MDALETGLEWLTHERIGNSLNTGICNREYVHGRKQQYPQCERLYFLIECSTFARERLRIYFTNNVTFIPFYVIYIFYRVILFSPA